MQQLCLEFDPPPVLKVEGLNMVAYFLRQQRTRVPWGDIQPGDRRRVVAWWCRCTMFVRGIEGGGL